MTDFFLDLILAEAIESKIASHLSDASYEGRLLYSGLEENVQTFFPPQMQYRNLLTEGKTSFSRTTHNATFGGIDLVQFFGLFDPPVQ